LTVSNKKLQTENRKMRAELDRLRDSGVLVHPIESEDEEDTANTINNNDHIFTPTTPGFMPTPPIQDPLIRFGNAGVTNLTFGLQNTLDTSLLSNTGLSNLFMSNDLGLSGPNALNTAMDPFLIDYCSSSGLKSPETASSPHSSSSPPLSPNEENFTFAKDTTDTNYQDFDSQTFGRFTKRRLLVSFMERSLIDLLFLHS
jgi:hypothetical protein